MSRSDDSTGGLKGRTPAADGGEPDDGRLPASVVADLRASEHRRRALKALADREEAIPVSDLAREVVAAERGEQSSAVSAASAESARTELFQRHLPKLTATGVVRYDSLVGTVELVTDDPRLLGEDDVSVGERTPTE